MAWIDTIAADDARGPLKQHYDDAIRRAGRVYNIVRLMSPNPAVLKASMDLYLALMYGPSPLSRAQRELLATVVSRANRCRY
ncbi:MAG TPA: carboxymuconolactone decarboxylase family protein [Phycisphaerae bacterium]|nr:carboxymuconolactone decarboxylase family protein [Phycisphaerae bacterium]